MPKFIKSGLLNILRKITVVFLVRVSEKIAFVRPISAYPGWKFGKAEEGRISFLTFLRISIWKYFNKYKISVPITIKWYNKSKIRMYLGNDSSRCLFIDGCIEPNEFNYININLKKGMVFIDIGANEGIFTIFASRIVGESGKVIAIEPSAREYKRLIDNIKINNISNVLTEKIAIGDTIQKVKLRIADYEHEGQNTLGNFIYNGVNQLKTEEVNMLTLDKYISEHNIKRIDFIKMDIEGAEYKALLGSKETVKKHKPTFIFELSDSALRLQKSSADILIRSFKKFGYEISFFDDFSGLPAPMSRNIYQGNNILAVHKDR